MTRCVEMPDQNSMSDLQVPVAIFGCSGVVEPGQFTAVNHCDSDFRVRDMCRVADS